MTLAERVVAIHRALRAHRIPHAFGGAFALAYATLDPRGTRDIDVNVFVKAADAERALAALPEGVDRPEGSAATVARDGQIRLWWDDTPLDLFFDYDPIHEQAARNRRIVPFEGEKVPILGPVELAVFKAYYNRTRDWADIEAMAAAGSLELGPVRVALADLVGGEDERIERLEEAARRGEAAGSGSA